MSYKLKTIIILVYRTTVGDKGYFNVLNKFFSGITINTPVTSLNYTNNDILCEDRDGDGYYWWGIGSKPSTCPVCSPELPDADDANPSLGPWYKDESQTHYGFFYNIPPVFYHATFVSSDQTWNSSTSNCGDLYIQSGAVLTINSTLIMGSQAKIYVMDDSKLVVDGGLIKNSNIIVQNGCELILNNNAILEKDFNDELTIELGGVFDFSFGEVKNNF